MTADNNIDEQARDILNRAADSYESEPHRWIQDKSAIRGEDGCVTHACVLVMILTGGNLPQKPDTPRPGDASLYAAMDMLHAYLGIRGNVAYWNDCPYRTAEQVIAALRGAAASDH